MSLSKIVDLFFEEKRVTMSLMIAWLVITCTLFYKLGAFHMQFMTLGPSKDTTFMGMVIDDWWKWSALAGFSFMNTAMNEFLDSALSPWFVNTLQDHKTKHLPYSKFTCLVISQLFTIYSHVMSVFGIFLFFSQFDFLMIRLVADLLVNHYVTYRFMANKVVDPTQYARDRDAEWVRGGAGAPMQPMEGFVLLAEEGKNDAEEDKPPPMVV